MDSASKLGEQAMNLGHNIVEKVEAGYEKVKETIKDATSSNKDEKKWVFLYKSEWSGAYMIASSVYNNNLSVLYEFCKVSDNSRITQYLIFLGNDLFWFIDCRRLF